MTVMECQKVTYATMTPMQREQAACLLTGKLESAQGIVMIDKYYRENPEKWNTPIGLAMLDAVTISGGPCGKAESRR